MLRRRGLVEALRRDLDTERDRHAAEMALTVELHRTELQVLRANRASDESTVCVDCPVLALWREQRHDHPVP